MSNAILTTSSPRRNPRLRPSRRRHHPLTSAASAPAAPAASTFCELTTDARAAWAGAAALHMSDAANGGGTTDSAEFTAEQLAAVAEELHRASMWLGQILICLSSNDVEAAKEDVLRVLEAVASADSFLTASFDALRLAAGVEGFDLVRVDNLHRPTLCHVNGGAR